ncbi:hypothetical protein [Serratia odorifera]|nr:hypothetical protein [Serratia odorifera]PNK91383.1 hypothetical protein CEQ31_017710 [Serratia odorifera]RII72528.1 hypothetical protein DX901_08720 [Serratia odorifera]VDZ55971.1 Uncharacterised protein [Serratia odorifera]
MPVITFHLSPSWYQQHPVDSHSRLQQACRDLCVELLDAETDKVQIQMLLACQPLLGSPLYAEVKYRQQPHRDQALMATFMQELERIIDRHYHLATPRIRCFPLANNALYAKN